MKSRASPTIVAARSLAFNTLDKSWGLAHDLVVVGVDILKPSIDILGSFAPLMQHWAEEPR